MDRGKAGKNGVMGGPDHTTSFGEEAFPGIRRWVTASRGLTPENLRLHPLSTARRALAERGSGSKRKSTRAGALHSARDRKLATDRRKRPSQTIAGLAIAAAS